MILIKNFLHKPKYWNFHDINEIVTNVILDDKLNIYENAIINNNYLYIIKNLISKEKGKNINNLKYIGEKEGPIIEGNIINVLIMPQNIEIIFKKGNILVGKTIDKSSKEIFDFITGGIEIGKYHIYEFN